MIEYDSFAGANSIFPTRASVQVRTNGMSPLCHGSALIAIEFLCYRFPDIWQSPTDCAFTQGTAQPSQPTWVDNGARLVKNNAKKTAQKQTIFDGYTSTARPRLTSPANHLESLENDKPPAINIQIHNVFSFQNDKPKNSSASMSPMSQDFDNRFQIPYPLNQSNVFFAGDELN